MRKRTWKRALSGMLSAMLVLSGCAAPASDGSSAKAAEDTFTDVYSEDYETATENSKWTSAWTDAAGVTDTIKDGAWNTWTPDAQNAEFTAKFTDLAAGEYRLSLVAVGGDMDVSTVSLGTVSKEILINEWGKGNTPTITDTVTVDASGTLTATLKLAFKKEGWCHIDDVRLQLKSSADEALAAEKAKLTTLVTECKALVEAWYSEKTWTSLKEALAAAEAVTAKADATKEEFSAAYKSLKLAKNRLMEKSVYVNKIDGLSQDFMRGVDISSYVSIVESGATFKDADGKVLDDQGFFQLLKESGVNWVRIRVWNDPYNANGNGYGGGNNDLAKAVKMGKWATAAGIRVLIDFHYSDTWADPQRQLVPKAWKDYTLDQKETALYDYTKASVQKLLDEGVDVGMVQIGNETNKAIAGESDWDHMAKLFQAGSKAVREVSKDILVALHFTDPQVADELTGLAEKLKNSGVDYDVFASSYYPANHGTMENITKVLSDVAKNYGKKVLVAETAWAWTNADGDGHEQTFSTVSDPDYRLSVQGQATEVRDVVEAVHNVEGGAGIGVFYWEPAWIPVEYAYDEDGKRIESVYNSNKVKWETYGSGVASSYAAGYDNVSGVESWYGGSVMDNQSFFDFEGNPLPSLTVFKDIYTGTQAPVLRLEKIKDGSAEVLLQTSDVASAIDTIAKELPATVTGIYNDSSRKELAVTWDLAELKEKVTSFGNHKITGTTSYKDEFNKDVEAKVSCDIAVFPDSILENGDFEEFDDGSWTLENADTTQIKWNDTPMRGEGTLHFWNASGLNFSLKQTVEAETAGYYCASMYAQGAEAAGNVLTISVTNLTTKASASKDIPLKGWAVWQSDTTDSVSAAAGDELQVVITVKGEADAWGSIDDVFLYKTNKAPVEEKKEDQPVVSKSNKCTKLNPKKSTYTIKKKGKTATVVFTVTAEDKTKVTTDKVKKVATKNKKIAVVVAKKTKLTKGKLTVVVKGVKKGSTSLTVKVGSQTKKVNIKVKK